MRATATTSLLLATLLVAIGLPNGSRAASTEEEASTGPGEASAGPEGAAEDEATPPTHRTGWESMRAPSWMSHRLSFRLRPELLVGGDLGPGESGVPEPLRAASEGGDEKTLGWASVRLRYEGVVHVGEPWSIHVGVDALDNLLLGSTHVNAGGNFNRGLWHDAQASPASGINSFRDAVRVNYAFARWEILEFLTLDAGRMDDSFGLGLLRHGGRCRDCDFGTYVDGIRMGFDLFGMHFGGSWELTGVGATTAMPGVRGQPVDLGLVDNLQTFTLRVSRRHEGGGTLEDASDAEGSEDGGAGEGDDASGGEQGSGDSEHAAEDAGEPRMETRSEATPRWSVDWGIFASFADQNLSSSEPEVDRSGSRPRLERVPERCRESFATTAAGQIAVDPSCYRLIPRGAFFFRPQAHLDARWRPQPGHELRVAAEGGAVVGDVDNLQRIPELDDTGKRFRGFGGALEARYRWPGWRVGLDTGAASGDDGRYLGVKDGQNIVVPDDDQYSPSGPIARNDTVTSYWFHRDYRIDLILFRQVVGAVTNAVYVKPWVGMDLLDRGRVTLDARFDLLYAAAANRAGTPGGGRHYGVELDGRLQLGVGEHFEASLGAGGLLPMGALGEAEPPFRDPNPAFALRALLTWRY